MKTDAELMRELFAAHDMPIATIAEKFERSEEYVARIVYNTGVMGRKPVTLPRVLAAVPDDGGATSAEIAERAEYNRNATRVYLHRLAAAGKVIRVGHNYAGHIMWRRTSSHPQEETTNEH